MMGERKNPEDTFSPRMWRCFFFEGVRRDRAKIFSTYVEVFLGKLVESIFVLNFLHVCGGVSASTKLHRNVYAFSPRMWRCFPVRGRAHSIA